jgi:hypothetical protein
LDSFVVGLAIFELSLEALTVGPGANSLAVELAVFVVSLVASTIGEGLNSI